MLRLFREICNKRKSATLGMDGSHIETLCAKEQDDIAAFSDLSELISVVY